MKTRTWLIILLLFALLCGGLSFLLLAKDTPAGMAEVYSDGKLVQRIDLRQDGIYHVEFGSEWNELTVKDGQIAVTAASCASQDCVHRGTADSGLPIVCLPNRLVIRFTDEAVLDAIVGS